MEGEGEKGANSFAFGPLGRGGMWYLGLTLRLLQPI